MIWQDAFLQIPALPVWPLPHEIADHLFDIQKVLHCRPFISMWEEAAVLADWSSCRLEECAGRSAEM